MNKKLTLFIDQHGSKKYARSVKELREKTDGGGSRVSKMFVSRNGQDYHVGYVVGSHWFSAFQAVEIEA